LILIIASWSLSTARVLKVVTIGIEPFSYIRTTTEGKQEGYLVDLMDDLMARAANGTEEPLSYQFYETPDKKFGTQDENGKWIGMVGEVVDGKADMAVAPLTVTKARSAAVYYSHPYMTVVLVPLIKKPAPGDPMPFYNITDLRSKLESGDLTMGFQPGGSTESYLRDNKKAVVREIYNITKAGGPLPANYLAGIEKVRSSNGKFVFYGEHTGLQMSVLTGDCDLMINWFGALGDRHYAFIFQKTEAGRALMEKFNQLIMAAEADGTTFNLVGKWWYRKATCPTTRVCRCQE